VSGAALELGPLARAVAGDLCRSIPAIEDGVAGMVAAIDAWEALASAWAAIAELSDDEALRIASARAEQLRALAAAATARGVALLAVAALERCGPVGFDVVEWARRFGESDLNPRGGGLHEA